MSALSYTLMADQIDVAVNAPEAGTIKEFLVKEDESVTVGQDLLKLELGGSAPGGKKEAKSEPKAPASDKQATSSQPGGEKEKAAPKQPTESNAPSDKQDAKPQTSEVSAPQSARQPDAPQSQTASKPAATKVGDSKTSESKVQGPFGKRDERRV